MRRDDSKFTPPNGYRMMREGELITAGQSLMLNSETPLGNWYPHEYRGRDQHYGDANCPIAIMESKPGREW